MRIFAAGKNRHYAAVSYLAQPIISGDVFTRLPDQLLTMVRRCVDANIVMHVIVVWMVLDWMIQEPETQAQSRER